MQVMQEMQVMQVKQEMEVGKAMKVVQRICGSIFELLFAFFK